MARTGWANKTASLVESNVSLPLHNVTNEGTPKYGTQLPGEAMYSMFTPSWHSSRADGSIARVTHVCTPPPGPGATEFHVCTAAAQPKSWMSCRHWMHAAFVQPWLG